MYTGTDYLLMNLISLIGKRGLLRSVLPLHRSNQLSRCPSFLNSKGTSQNLAIIQDLRVPKTMSFIAHPLMCVTLQSQDYTNKVRWWVLFLCPHKKRKVPAIEGRTRRGKRAGLGGITGTQVRSAWVLLNRKSQRTR